MVDPKDFSSIPVMTDVLMPGRAEFARSEALAGETPAKALPQDRANGLDRKDMDAVTERLYMRFSSYIRGDGRRALEACTREALDEHMAWLTRQVAREIAFTFEAKVAEWIRDAVREELAKR